jgi:hypothetical protein
MSWPRLSVVILLTIGSAGRLAAQSALAGETIHISRAAGPIHIDGELSDEGWHDATRIDQFFEVSPGDNVPPPVKTVGFITYDEHFLYVALECDDPNPVAIRAPLADHDAVNGNSMDFGGVFLDPLNTGRTAVEFFVTPSNVQYDAITDDASGENSSPDFFWDSATMVTAHGWTVEMRIPFSTLRYRTVEPQTWGIILFRNYPRQYRFQIFSARLPKGNNCLVCYANRLVGLEQLPRGGHVIVAPYVTGTRASQAADDMAGAPLVAKSPKGRAGFDVKYTPNANNAVDVTVRPDFSQVESDVAQISANERFALFYPEKRPFFLEGVDLLQTPFQAVYTRTITSPEWGTRATGKEGGIRFTALAVDDAGGGTVVIPGPNGSTTADQPSGSTVLIARAKKEVGLSFVGAILTDREGADGAAHNRVAGPDFQWRPSASNVVTGQWLVSDTRTPTRPDLADEWDGRRLTGRAWQAYWNHNTRHLDWFAKYANVGTGFRADTGFIPQVGYRDVAWQTGWQVYPTGFLRRERTFLNVDYQTEQSGAEITRDIEPGIGMDTRWNGFLQFRYVDNATRAGSQVIERRQFGYIVQFSPSRRVSLVAVNGTLGEDIDFDNARPAHGPTINAELTVQPSNHFALDLIENTRSLSEDVPGLRDTHLFTQRVSRLKGTYTFTSRLFVRVIGQWIATDRDPRLFVTSVDARSETFAGSALLAYKINWQSVMFVGYGDDRELANQQTLKPLDHQVFVKVSYAFQR